MITEKMKEFLKAKQAVRDDEPIKPYALQITSANPYQFRLVLKKGTPPIQCEIRRKDSDTDQYSVQIGEAVYHIGESSLSPEKIIMLVNDYLITL